MAFFGFVMCIRRCFCALPELVCSLSCLLQCVKIADSNAEWEDGNNHQLKVSIHSVGTPAASSHRHPLQCLSSYIIDHLHCHGCFCIERAW